MIAAIYARKSTEQTGIVDEQRSVSRQVEHARHYAERKGWTVDESAIFIDDGVSGAEFANRPGFLRLMNALKPRPSFQALIMSEESRLGREAIETAYALKQLVTAGVRVFFYLEDRERTLDSPTDKIMMSLTAFADELEREKARQRTYDAMIRKARAGHVTGGAVFGYRNVDVLDADGRRQHVVREVIEEEAAVVQRIFHMCAKGHGLTTIAKTLNAEGARCPRSQQGRPRGWAPSSVREALYRELYRGVIVWNRTRKRNHWGQQAQHDRPEGEWLRIPAPSLRVVPEDLWEAVHERLRGGRERYLRLNNGRVLGRPPAVGTKYLLSGLLTCGTCGSSLEAHTRSHGRHRAPFYGCAAHHRKGSSICRNNLEIPMADADEAVLATIEQVMLDPSIVAEIAERAVAELQVDHMSARREQLEQERARVDGELARFTEALAAGGELATILSAIRSREATRAQLQRELDGPARPPAKLTDLRTLRSQVDERIRDWRGLLRRRAEQGQQLLRRLIVGRLTVHPEVDADGRYYRFRGQGTWSRLLGGLVPECNFDRPQNLASPTGTFVLGPVDLEGEMRRRRAA